MHTHKRFRTPKSVLIIILIALALVAWAGLGYAVKPDGSGQNNYLHDLPVVVNFRDDPPDQVQSDSLRPYIDGESRVMAILGGRFGVFGLEPETRNKPKPGSRTVSLDFSDKVANSGGEPLPPEFPLGEFSPQKAFIRTSRPDDPNDRYQYDLRAMAVGSPLSVPLMIIFSFDEALDGENDWYMSLGDVTIGDGWLDPNIDGSSGTPVTVTREPSELDLLSGDDHDSGIWTIEAQANSRACLHSVGHKRDPRVKYYGHYHMPFKLTIKTLDLANPAPPALDLRSGLTSKWGRIKADRQ